DHRGDRLGHLVHVRLAHERATARADLHVDQPTGLEHAQRVSDRDPRYAEALRELALGLEPVAGHEVAVEDLAFDLRHDLAGGTGLAERGERDPAGHAVAAAFCVFARSDASSRYTTLS